MRRKKKKKENKLQQREVKLEGDPIGNKICLSFPLR
jgi:hypothetical protein